jgi:hypothetical protein
VIGASWVEKVEPTGREGNSMSELEVRRFESPDEARVFPKLASLLLSSAV